MHITITVWLHSLAIVMAAYLLGSIPTGYLLMKIFRKQDIRSIGSGNIGATNVLRSGAKGLGAATFLLDFLKGVAAVLVGAKLGSIGVPHLILHQAEALAALCAVLGHMFPIWLSLRGGKGVATAFGVFTVLVPWAALATLAIFIVTFALSRYVSLASIVSALVFPVIAWFVAPWTHAPVVMVVILIVAALILVKHSQNIGRLKAGTEYRFGSKKRHLAAEHMPGQAKDRA